MLIEGPGKKKSPDRFDSIRGYPFFSTRSIHHTLQSAKAMIVFSQVGLLTFPPFQRSSRSLAGTVTHMAERVPFSNGKKRDYSGGPVPELHGVSFYAPTST
jgi:hypothetical protein